MSTRGLVASLLPVALVLLVLPGRASAYCQMTTDGGAQVGDAPCVERGEPLVWEDTCLSYAIDARGSVWMDYPEVEAAVDAAFAAWQNVDCDQRVVGSGNPPNVIFKPLQPSTCQRAEFNTTGNVNTIAFLDPWQDPCAEEGEAYDPFAFAVTVVWHNTSTGQILDADMMVNDQLATRFNAGGPYDDCPDSGCPAGSPGVPGPADLRSIITHEAGHFIGIGHSDIEEATMFASTERDSVDKRTLELDDINAICDIYPPGGLDASCDPTPIGGLLLNCETDVNGDPLICDEPGAPNTGNGGGCSVYRNTDGSSAPPWSPALIALLLWVTAMRRRSRRFAG